MKWFLIFILLLLAPGPPAKAQDPWRSRIWRERVVAAYGPVARPMVETYSDVGCQAMSSCSWNVGTNLAWFHNNGGLAATPRPVELLQAIGQHGDVVAWYVMQHPELRNLDECDGFLSCPLDIALGVYPLEAAVAGVRAKRLQGQAQKDLSINGRPVATIAGIALLIGLLVWWKKRRRGVPGAA